MKRSQESAPLFETVFNHAKKRMISFHTPGHKNGRSIDKKLLDFTGKNVYYFDVTVFPEVDSLHDTTGCIKQAQELMAKAYGVEHSFFLVNGSSVGNQAMFLSACKPGDSVILSRNLHKSVLSGIILTGIWPIWLQPQIDQNLDIILDAEPDQIAEAIKKFPEAKAVFITSPTYNGVTSDLLEIANICHKNNKLLLVDEAHGPHLRFHRDFPISAVESGADMVVQSVHKILSAMSQGSVLHVNSDRIDVSRVRKVVSMLQTTSPNYLILSSIDLARRQAVMHGEKLLGQIISSAEYGRKKINRLKNLSCFTREDIRSRGYDLDVTKLTVNVTKTGLSGLEVEDLLNENYNIQVDCADIFNLIAIMGIGSTQSDVNKLVKALEDIDKKHHGTKKNWDLNLPSLTTEMVLIPRDVFLSKESKRVPLNKAVGHISAQSLTPYPPGIPILIPGERITREICDYLYELSKNDIRVSGQETDALKTVKVVK
ncbi:MAG: aminotransferase class I/II-fold pyridoxal phosphate-dependent enzyme [Elusimicrobia bacterium]|nr:aminotransferase class I/II-fold pyridoxal phosphate-dependent enzyme [Elusimicrobiota bacterium]